MKKLMAFTVMLVTLLSTIKAQSFMEKFFDENFRLVPSADVARFYSISKKTDSGWRTQNFYLTVNKIQMIGLYEDKDNAKKNGNFYTYYPDGKIKSAIRYKNNLEDGLLLSFYNDGSLKDSVNFKAGHHAGTSLSWYKNGFAKDSITVQDDGRGAKVAWFDNGVPSEAGRYIDFEKKQGKWQYFHKNGNISAEEIYADNILLSKKYYNEEGMPTDTSGGERNAFFPGGEKKWSKFISSQLYFPGHLEFKNVANASVVVTATVDEEGNVIDAEVTVPLHPEFDKIALNSLKKSPKWEPAVSHNRKVYSTFKQTVIYSQGN
jgi:antitoxin component YwqK of YwqJK toxin-antitoxin module